PNRTRARYSARRYRAWRPIGRRDSRRSRRRARHRSLMLRVAITRAQPEAEKTAAHVRARGGEAVLAPLLSIEPRPFELSAAGAQALLFTSSNGVHAFAAQATQRDIAAFAVGESTAAAARAAGFAEVRAAGGDVAALAQLVQAALDPRAGALIHISGAHVAGD